MTRETSGHNVEIEEKPFVLIIINCPNNDKPQFYSELKSKIEEINF